MAVSLLDIAPGGQPWLPESNRGYGTIGSGGSSAPFGYGLSAQQQAEKILRDRQARYAQPAPSLAPALTATGNTTSPFTAETLVKNPELAEALKRLYGDIGSLSTDPTKNQTVLQRNVKLPEVEAAGQAALATQQADATNNAQSIADFTKSFMAAQPAAEATANEEAGAIGRLYSGEYGKELAANRAKTGILTTQNLLRRLGMINAGGNLGRLGAGGVTNSITDANLMREAANASIARDLEFQGQERSDIMDILGKQIGAGGLRQRLIDSVLQRPLTPIQAGQSVAGNDVNRLNAISGLLMGNSTFTPQTRAGLVQQVQQLLAGQAGIDPAAYYRYVRGDFPDQYPGVVPQGRLNLPNIDLGGGGGGSSFDDLIAAMTQYGGGGAQPTLPGAPLPSNRPNPHDPAPGVWNWQAERRNRFIAENGYDPNFNPGVNTDEPVAPGWLTDFTLN